MFEGRYGMLIGTFGSTKAPRKDSLMQKLHLRTLIVMLMVAWLVSTAPWPWSDAPAARGQQPQAESSPASDAQPAEAAAPAEPPTETPSPDVDVPYAMFILAVGVAIVLGLIIGLKINAFIALITAAMVVSLLASGPLSERIARVATAFGSSAGKIGIVIALAAVIGKCMLDSGAADRIVRSFLRVLGERQAPVALMSSGFVLAIPVFFDTVFYLLVPLARSLYRTTNRNYLKYVLAIGAGGAITHTLVPPTPGPLVMADQLDFDPGWMILVGGFVALFGAATGLIFANFADRKMPVPMRQIGNEPDPKPLPDDQLPSLFWSLAPVVLPVVLISSNTVLNWFAKTSPALQTAAEWSSLIGNANLALLLATVIALAMLVRQRNLSRSEMAHVVETSLMSGGVIILITSGGGAFGAMLGEAQVGDAIRTMFEGVGGSGSVLLVLGFSVAAVLKIAQGSSTVAMITGSAMLAGIASPDTLGCHPVYLATAIGGGSLVGSWMNDSGFWIFAKMSGLTEVEALKSWTPMLVLLGVVSLVVTLVMANLMPLV
jgi:GntP family gluconate:H+ symporter